MAQDTLSNDMPSSIEMTKDLLRPVFEIDDAAERNLIPFLWGPPGVGKTALINQLADELEMQKPIIIRTADLRPEDLTGPPFPHKEGYSEFHPPKSLLKLTKEWQAMCESGKLPAEEYEGQDFGKTLIFFDEFTGITNTDIMAALQILINDRRFGVDGYELRDNVHMVAAGNRPEDGAYTMPLSTALQTRFGPHILVHPTIEEWVKWARRNDVLPTIIAFLPQHEELMYQLPNRKSKAFTYPSFRSWAKTSEMLKLVPEDAMDLREQIVVGTVGPGAGSEYMNFERTARHAPTAEQIAKKPTEIDTYDDQPDIALVAVENMISAAKRHPDWISPFIQYGARMHDQYKRILYPRLLNVDGDMPEEAIIAALQSEHFSEIQDTAADVHRVMKKVEEDNKKGRGRR